jgi:hypothetical protein
MRSTVSPATSAGSPAPRSLEDYWLEFSRSRFLAMPIAGTIAWAVVGIAGLFLKPLPASLVLFIATGAIFYLALFVARFTGEDLLGRKNRSNPFNKMFLLTVVMATLVYAIAIPFYLVDRTSLPLTVGILTGLMWVPFSGLLRHWIGLFHGITRTVLIVAAWYLFPAHRFVVIPAIIVAIYAVTLVVLERRYRAVLAAT